MRERNRGDSIPRQDREEKRHRETFGRFFPSRSIPVLCRLLSPLSPPGVRFSIAAGPLVRTVITDFESRPRILRAHPLARRESRVAHPPLSFSLYLSLSAFETHPLFSVCPSLSSVASAPFFSPFLHSRFCCRHIEKQERQPAVFEPHGNK